MEHAMMLLLRAGWRQGKDGAQRIKASDVAYGATFNSIVVNDSTEGADGNSDENEELSGEHLAVVR
jgi:hypothetical protein